MTRDRNAAVSRRRAAPTRSGSLLADIMLTLGFSCWSMAATVIVLSYASEDFGEAGRPIGLMFAAMLVLAGGFLWLLGVTLLRDGRWSVESYLAPLLFGAIAGVLQALVLFNLWTMWLWTPFVPMLFALHPVRRAVFSPLYGRAS